MAVRQRERFERIDVPRETPYRNVIGGVVCAVVLVIAAIVVGTVWNRVQLESRLGDTGLTGALEGQGATGLAEGGLHIFLIFTKLLWHLLLRILFFNCIFYFFRNTVGKIIPPLRFPV